MHINNNNINFAGNFDAQSVEINFYETLYAKNQLQIWLLFLDIVKTMQTCCFGNFGNFLPSPQYQIVANFHAYLHAKNQLCHSILFKDITKK